VTSQVHDRTMHAPVPPPTMRGREKGVRAWKGRVTPVNTGHSSPSVSPRKLGLTWGHVF